MELFVIKNLKPFNRFFFRSCYFHQLISAYGSFGIPAETIISNYKNRYCTEENSLLKCTEAQIFNRLDFAQLTGVTETHLPFTETDVVFFLKERLRLCQPCIVIIDYFYLPFRQKLYKKVHTDHYILVYGFDEAQSEFIIQEVDSDKHMQYAEKRIAFSALRDAYMSGCKIKRKGRDAVVFLEKMKSFCLENYLSTLRDTDGAQLTEKLQDLQELELTIARYAQNAQMFVKAKSRKNLAKAFDDLKWQKLREMNQALFTADFFGITNKGALSAAYYNIVKNYMVLKNLCANEEKSEKNVCVQIEDLYRLLNAEKNLAEVRYGNRFNENIERR